MTISHHILPARVYWEDTDASGLVYHGSYLNWMERGRTELLRDLGVNQGELFKNPAGAMFFVVRRMEIDFVKPALLDDVIAVTTTVRELGGASLLLLQRVTRANETLCEAQVRCVCVKDGRAHRIPSDIRDKMGGLATAFAKA